MAATGERTPFRWRSAEQDEAGALFPDERAIERHVGTGEFRGMEFLHVNARSIINTVPAASRMPFRHTINAYRGCSHACVYCASGDTIILMGDGRTKPLVEVRRGDLVYGTVRRGGYRRYAITEVLDHWSTMKPAYRTTLEDGTQLVTSGDHRFLTGQGWKHVTGSMSGPDRRSCLTTDSKLIGTGHFAKPPDQNAQYRLGYLSGIVPGDGAIGSYRFRPRNRRHVHFFRLALVDLEGLKRTRGHLKQTGIRTREFSFQEATMARRSPDAIARRTRAGVAAIRELTRLSPGMSEDWCKGFLAGIFDAEGGWNQGILRLANKNPQLVATISMCLRRFEFDHVVEVRPDGLASIRIRGGLKEHLRFFHTVDPAITPKRSFEGMALESNTKLRIVSIEPLGLEMPMYDITTGTGDFIANGVVSHNCFARPTHDYLGLDIGEDFEKKIVVKINAVERLRSELRSPKWNGDHIAMGTNTDPYQHAEGKYHLTRGIVRTLGEFGNPFSILTKSTLVLRDLKLLEEAAKRASVRCNVSIGTLDRDVWKLTEPGTPPPDKRVDVVRRLNDAGIECGVLVAPILPGLSDSDEQIEQVVAACMAAGAVSIAAVGLHLRPGVREHFLGWLGSARPDLVPLYEGRFARGAYQPKSIQARIGALVSGLARSEPGRDGYVEGYDTRNVGEARSILSDPCEHTDQDGKTRSEQLRLL